VKILLVGAGAREHALAASLNVDPAVSQLHAAPGNPGIGQLATRHGVDPNNPEAIADLAASLSVDLVVIGPEAPLVAGVSDAVQNRNIPVFGPSKAAAALEGSKAFAKEIMAAANVPTGDSRVCRTVEEVAAALDEFGAPHVVKDDGLAAGKGVIVTPDRAEALAHAAECLRKPGAQIVVEEFLDGPEVSLFCITDGVTVVPLEPAQDFKRAFDNDAGPNTGGMGAYSPLPWAPADLTQQVVAQVAQPTVDEMRRRGTPFVGVVYCGLALTSKGPRVIEFNARFGDPETQVVLARLRTPLAGLLHAAATGNLAALPALEWHDKCAVNVVIASEGYPATASDRREITGLDSVAAQLAESVQVFHAATCDRGVDGSSEPRVVVAAGGSENSLPALVCNGGRVLSVVGTGGTIAAARDAAYAGVKLIELDGSHHRSDIAAGV